MAPLPAFMRHPQVHVVRPAGQATVPEQPACPACASPVSLWTVGLAAAAGAIGGTYVAAAWMSRRPSARR